MYLVWSIPVFQNSCGLNSDGLPYPIAVSFDNYNSMYLIMTHGLSMNVYQPYCYHIILSQAAVWLSKC